MGNNWEHECTCIHVQNAKKLFNVFSINYTVFIQHLYNSLYNIYISFTSTFISFRRSFTFKKLL